VKDKIKEVLTNKESMKKIKRVAYISFLLIIVVISFSANSMKSNKAVKALLIDIEPLATGNRMIDTSDVYEIVELGFGSRLVGERISDIDEARIERIVSEYPMVAEAEVFLNAQDELNISIVQKQPLLRVIADNGLNYYMDNKGARIPLSKHVTERLLVVTGNIPPHVPNFMEEGPELLQDVFELGKMIHKDEFFNAMIEQVDVQGKEFVLIPKMGRQKIKFGTLEDAESKLKRLKRYYKEVVATTGWNTYKTIDVRFDKQVVCQKR
jgi:cell division protein FtsQ